MVPRHLVFNKSAIARVLKVHPRLIVSFREFDRVVWVHIAGKRPTFVSKAKLVANFHEFRRESGRGMHVIPVLRTASGESYSVIGKTGTYHVTAAGKMACTCEDAQQHSEHCKHQWAVLHALGLSSFDRYLQARERLQPVNEVRKLERRNGTTYDRTSDGRLLAID